MRIVLAHVLALTALVSASTFARAQPAPGMTPTTKILAIGTVNPGVDPARVREILASEVRETVELYLDGKIDQWFSLRGRVGVAFIMNGADVEATRQLLDGLPLGKAHLMTFELIPLAPLNPLRQLQGMKAGTP